MSDQPTEPTTQMAVSKPARTLTAATAQFAVPAIIADAGEHARHDVPRAATAASA